MTNAAETTEVTATAPVATTKAEKPAKAPKAEKAPKAPKAEKAPKEKKPTATKAEKPAKEAKPVVESKKSKVIPVVQAAIAAGTARKDTLAKLQADLGISAACANTYYQNVKSGTWK